MICICLQIMINAVEGEKGHYKKEYQDTYLFFIILFGLPW